MPRRYTSAPMQALRRRLQRVTWIALVAMLGLALAPTLSRAFAATAGFDPWAELCSTVGSKTAGGEPRDAVAMPDHCPLCSHLAEAPMLPTPDVAALPSPDGADYLPALFAHSPRPLFAWAAAQARAPPSVS